MGIKIKNCRIENCGTAIKAEGKVNMSINGLTLKDNKRDLDFTITDDSIIELENIFSNGAKLESISIKQYNASLECIKSLIGNSTDLSVKDKEMIVDKLNHLHDNKDPKLFMKILLDIKEKVKSVPGQVVISMIVNELTKLISNI